MSQPEDVTSRRLDRLRIRHLRLLEKISSTGSLTGAALALRISQPAATKMLQELERTFGCVLVERTARGGVLTSAGTQALERLHVALGMVDATGLALATQPEMPLVRIGILRLAGVALIPSLVAALHAAGRLPRMRLHEGTASGLLENLRKGEVDCVIGRLESQGDAIRVNEFDIVPLTDEHYEVACSPAHPLAGESAISWDRLQQFPWAVPPPPSYTWHAFETGFRKMGLVPPQPRIESPSFHDSFAILAQTDFLAIAPRSAVAYYQMLGRVQRLDLKDPFPTDHAVLVTMPGIASQPTIRLIRQALLQACSTICKAGCS